VNEPLYQVSEDIPLNALITDPGLNDIQVCQVDWGDGTTTDGLVNNGNCTASYAYTFEGEYTITVTATDDDGGSGSDSAIVIISGEPQPSTGAVYLPLMTMDWNSSR
jgi:PKD repeat protein